MPHPDELQRADGDESPLRTNLRERNKELRFLHHAARLINMRGEPREIVGAVLDLLPSAMLHPELAGARFCLGSLEIATQEYQSSKTSLQAKFDMDDGESGLIEVCYSLGETAPTAPTFLDEERSLLASLSELLKAYFERHRADTVYERLLRAEAAERNALAENQAKDRFLSTVAHDLRSSLQVMLGWVQVLRQNPKDPGVATRGLQILERNVTLQAKLIEDLLDLSRIISGKVVVDRRPLDLAELVSYAVDATRPATDAKGLLLSCEIEPVGTLLADQQRLQQVVYNILGNAVKFTPAGGRIHVALARQGSWARLVVADTGPGIDAALLPHVFERFRQADHAKKGRNSGLGLGLPIARHLVELHQGTITVRSRPDEPGTTFEISLPLEG
jgi:signal transduction histidine kinase